jgi:hypothetical protein
VLVGSSRPERAKTRTGADGLVRSAMRRSRNPSLPARAVASVAQAGRRHHQGREDRDERDRAAQEERDPHQPHRRHADRREGHHFPVLGQPAHAEHRSEEEGHRQHVLEEVRNEVGQDADHVQGGDAAPEEDVGLREDLRGEQELGEEEERRRERQQDLAGEVAVEPRHAFLSAWSLS